VGLEEFRKNALVTREIEAIRPTPRASVPAPRRGSVVTRAADIAAVVLLAFVLAAVLLLRRHRRATSIPGGESLEPAIEPRAKAYVLVTAAGSTRELVIDVRPDADGILTIGGAGSAVELPGYRGRLPIIITTTDGVRGDVQVPEGVTASIGADRIDSQSGPVQFIGRTALKTAGAHIRIRLAPEGAAS
jgi:hypothetical protein